jgi:hypothetical protein
MLGNQYLRKKARSVTRALGDNHFVLCITNKSCSYSVPFRSSPSVFRSCSRYGRAFVDCQAAHGTRGQHRLGTAFHAVSSRGHWNIAGLLVVHGAEGHQQSDEGISRARTNGWAIIAFIPGAENKDQASEFRRTTPLLQQDSAKIYLGAPGRMGPNYYLLRQLIRVCPVIALCHSMSHY